jgi:hippurate hydrolase
MKAIGLFIHAVAVVVVTVTAIAQQSDGVARQEKVSRAIDADNARLLEIFKDLHQHPELGFTETRSAGIVAKELRALGFEVKEGIGKTGVVGILRNGDGPKVMYRCDLDGLPVRELTGVDYTSRATAPTSDGKGITPLMHACGHDAHMTWLLGMAKVMADMKDQWHGTLILVAQPAEEMIMGAQAMVNDGLYTKHGVPKPDYFLALHTTILPVGQAVSAGGRRAVGSDQLDILFKGVGGHGARPHLAKDPIIMAAYAVTEYQTIVSRIIEPGQHAVLTVGSIQAGSANNVIPDTALVKANLRWYEPKVREQLIKGIRDISDNIARTYGMPEDQLPVITMKGSAPVMVNDDALAKRMLAPLTALLGEGNVLTEFPSNFGSEDAPVLVSPFKDAPVPVNYMLVGIVDPQFFAASKNGGDPVPANHNPGFKVDLRAIPLGTKVAAVTVLELLGKTAR